MSPLSDRAARRLVGSEFASLVGDGMVLTAMPFAIDSIGGNGLEIAVALAAQAAGVAAMLPFAGVVGDRLARRSVMVRADLLRFVPQAAVAVLLLTGDAAFWQLLVCQVVHGIGSGLFMPASTAIVPEAVDEAALQPTNGLKTVGAAVAMVGAPTLGVVACGLIGPGVAMAADAATFAVSAALLAGIPARAPERLSEGFRREMRDGWKAFRGYGWLQAIVVQYTLINALVVAPFYVFAPTTADESLGGVSGWAFLLTCLSIGEIGGGLTAGRWRPDRPLVAGTVVMAVWIVPLLMLAVLAPVLWIGVALVVAGIANGIFVVLWDSTLQTHVEGDELARLASFEQFGSLVFVPLGFVLGGWMKETVGAGVGLAAGALILALSSLVVLLLPSVRQLRSKGEEIATTAGAIVAAKLRAARSVKVRSEAGRVATRARGPPCGNQLEGQRSRRRFCAVTPELEPQGARGPPARRCNSDKFFSLPGDGGAAEGECLGAPAVVVVGEGDLQTELARR